ncbi:tRNA lysidine(34) synthetase TilS [Glaesserella parasuis]
MARLHSSPSANTKTYPSCFSLFGNGSPPWYSSRHQKLWQQHNVPYWLRQRTPLIFYGDQLQCVVVH